MKNTKQIQKEVRERIKPQMIEGHYDPILINRCVEATLKAIDYAHSSTQLNIGFVKGQEVMYNFFDYKIMSIRYPKVYLKPLDDNNPYIETTIDTITAKNI